MRIPRTLVRAVAPVLALATVLAVATVRGGQHPAPATVPAADLSKFDPGNIISDGVFYYSAAMSASEIADFIAAQDARCVPGSDGTPCLAAFAQDTTAKAADAYCNGYQAATRESAATIIAKVAASCGINPRVLLVMLQKEQGLVTASGSQLVGNPYYKAMGYGCPDTPSGCIAQYYGFQNQVYDAARQFKLYAARPTRYTYLAGQTNQIGYYPAGATSGSFNYQNQTCGVETVYIQNQATAGLYNYTPYVPNAAALRGSRDSCSSFGNRNFWIFFTDWFGSTQGVSAADAASFTRALYTDVLGRSPAAAELSFWAGWLSVGMSGPQAARNFLTSDEQLHSVLASLYQAALRRSPEGGAYASWSTLLGADGNANELNGDIFGSPEAVATLGAGDLEQWVDAVYQGLLGRSAGPPEQQFWATVARTKGAVAAATQISSSAEAATMRLNAYYQRFLQRPADAGGLQTWLRVVQSGADVAVESAIAGSPEYWARAVARFPSS